MAYLLTMNYQEITNTLCPISLATGLGGSLITEHQQRGSQCNIQPGYQLGSSLPTACGRSKELGQRWRMSAISPVTWEKPQTNVESRTLLFLESPQEISSVLAVFYCQPALVDTEVIEPFLGIPSVSPPPRNQCLFLSSDPTPMLSLTEFVPEFTLTLPVTSMSLSPGERETGIPQHICYLPSSNPLLVP